MPNRAAWAEIDLAALRHNYEEIKKNIRGGAKLCAVVKADAYGHGALAVARVAVEAGASYLAVATLGEAIELRQAGFTVPILLLGLVLPDEARDIVDYDVTQVVCELPLAEAISREAVRQHKTAKVHLKVETGMGRIGIRPEEIGALAAAVKQLPNIEIEGMFSHFAMADSKDKTYTKGQLAKFEQALKAVEEAGVKLKIRHIAESAAILEIPEAHYDMVRAGVIQYGMWPSDEVTHPIDLKPVMKVCAKVVFMKTLHPGESIGYAPRPASSSRSARAASRRCRSAMPTATSVLTATAVTSRSAAARRRLRAASAWIRSWSMSRTCRTSRKARRLCFSAMRPSRPIRQPSGSTRSTTRSPA